MTNPELEKQTPVMAHLLVSDALVILELADGNETIEAFFIKKKVRSHLIVRSVRWQTGRQVNTVTSLACAPRAWWQQQMIDKGHASFHCFSLLAVFILFRQAFKVLFFIFAQITACNYGQGKLENHSSTFQFVRYLRDLIGSHAYICLCSFCVNVLLGHDVWFIL